MRVAWFRADSPATSTPYDHMPALIDALASDVHLDVITGARAHDFVVDEARRPHDLCVFETRNTPGSDFIWAYLFQYRGVLFLQDESVHDSRVRPFERQRLQREYEAEFLFNHGHAARGPATRFPRGTWPMLRAPLGAATLVVVPDAHRAEALEIEHPGTPVRVVPPFATASTSDARDVGENDDRPLRVWVSRTADTATIDRAISRARLLGVSMDLLPNDTPGIDASADVVVALEPITASGHLSVALHAMAMGKAVIVLEREATAMWPALDPQTWRPRDQGRAAEPLVVSLDPRDEEHSLVASLRALSQDRRRLRALGSAAHAWWLEHATLSHATAAWRAILREAVTMPRRPYPQDWPAHLDAHGLERLRATASAFDIPPERFGF